MQPSVDPAILRALAIDASQAKIASHGGSGFVSTYRITSDTTSAFIKTSTSKGAATMFEGEYASLNAIHNAVPSLAPKAFAWGELESEGHFLATEFLDMSSRSSGGRGSGMTLAQKLAQLHTTPIPDDFKDKGFGFPVPTCCGDTMQDNSWKSSWATFFAENRLMHILRCAEENNGVDKSLRELVESVVEKVVPRLLGDGHLGGKKGVMPVVCHGDLWSGNKGKAVFVGRSGSPDAKGAVEDVVFDPSVCYGHGEYDHGIMNMFGGFSGTFWKEYQNVCAKTEPVEEYEDRVKLYEAYHHLNHYSIFGGGYKSGAVGILNGLLKKYG